jgi:hypothetical protein
MRERLRADWPTFYNGLYREAEDELFARNLN